MAGAAYTDDEDEIIRAARHGELPAVAERLGRSAGAIRSRRTVLNGCREYMKSRPHKPSLSRNAKPAAAHRVRIAQSRFARPSWFEEDLGMLLKMK